MSMRSQKIGLKRSRRAVVSRKKVLRRRTAIRLAAKEERERAKKERDEKREFNRYFVTVRNKPQEVAEMDARQVSKRLEHNAKILAEIDKAEKAGLLVGRDDGTDEEKPKDCGRDKGGMVGGSAEVSWAPNND